LCLARSSCSLLRLRVAPAVAWIESPAALLLYLTRGLAAVTILDLAWLFVGVLYAAIARVLDCRCPLIHDFRVPCFPALYSSESGRAGVRINRRTEQWGYNTNTVLAALGIGGVPIALAAQKTI
jgi:hypothetical protein